MSRFSDSDIIRLMMNSNLLKSIFVALLTGFFGVFAAPARAGVVYATKGDATLERGGGLNVFKSVTHNVTLNGPASWVFDLNATNAGASEAQDLILMLANQPQTTVGYVAWHKQVTSGSVEAYRDSIMATLRQNFKVENVAYRSSTPTKSIIDVRLDGNRSLLAFLYSNDRYYHLLVTTPEDWSKVGPDVEAIVASFGPLK